MFLEKKKSWNFKNELLLHYFSMHVYWIQKPTSKMQNPYKEGADLWLVWKSDPTVYWFTLMILWENF